LYCAADALLAVRDALDGEVWPRIPFRSKINASSNEQGKFEFRMASQLSWNHYHKWDKLRDYKALSQSTADLEATGQGRKARALSSALVFFLSLLFFNRVLCLTVALIFRHRWHRPAS
jgi:hypothetical protein